MFMYVIILKCTATKNINVWRGKTIHHYVLNVRHIRDFSGKYHYCNIFWPNKQMNVYTIVLILGGSNAIHVNWNICTCFVQHKTYLCKRYHCIAEDYFFLFKCTSWFEWCAFDTEDTTRWTLPNDYQKKPTSHWLILP